MKDGVLGVGGAIATITLQWVNEAVAIVVGMMTIIFLGQKIFYRWVHERRLANHCENCVYKKAEAPQTADE